MRQEAVYPDLKTILVVEDDEAIGEVIQLVLVEEKEYEAVLVTNPYKAVDVAKQVKPDLFVIDYRLLGLNGIDLYDTLHQTDGLQHIPAIITSATIENYTSELQARKLTGLAKPFDMDELLAIIKQSVISRPTTA